MYNVLSYSLSRSLFRSLFLFLFLSLSLTSSLLRKVDSQLQSRIRLHVPKDTFLIYNCVPRKLKRHSSQNQNADIRHLLDSLVSALAVYATAFRSKLSLE